MKPGDPPAIGMPAVPVWSLWVRVLHVLLAVSVVTAWASGHWPPRWGFDEVHHTAGYVALAAVLLRLALGLAGEARGSQVERTARHARFRNFVRSPGVTLQYARQWLVAREKRHLGHNPLGAWMVVALLLAAGACSLTGLLYITDWLWGYAWLWQLHAALALLLVLLLPWHLTGVALASRRHSENLVAAMLHGRKRAPGPADID